VLKAARQATASATAPARSSPWCSRIAIRACNLFEDFCTCFNDADHVIIADVYAAGEAPIGGINGAALVQGLRERGHRHVDQGHLVPRRRSGRSAVQAGRCCRSADLPGWLPEDIAVTVLGVGSNLLVRDGGIPGVVIRLGRAFAEIRTEGTHVYAGAAALDLNVALAARGAGMAGLEFLSGIPGTIGGACAHECRRLWQRPLAGAGGCDGGRPQGQPAPSRQERHGLHLSPQQRARRLDLLRRRTRGHAGDPRRSSSGSTRSRRAREASQPVRARTGGSTFVNPVGGKAWELVDKAGCRGLKLGGAMVSEKHCNFLINTGEASAAEIEALGETVRRRVRETSGVELAWEIKRIGVPADSSLAIAAKV
jgi:UDP-N-acetylmuramate dehydrogenase